MQIIKPNKLSLISKTYGFNGNQFTVGALCFFKLGKKTELLTENSQWPRITQYLNSGMLLDMGFAKPNGEVLVAGKAFAPNNKAVDKMQVAISLGKVKKRLTIVGDRKWTGSYFSPASSPEKFTEMPLVYQHAYGGNTYDQNPLGKGIIEKQYQDNGYYYLPNIYLSNESSKADKRRKTSAGFAPLDICWPQRACYQGSYDKHWLENDHPGFPKNTNPKLFNAAPLDQQIKGYFSPGEPYQLNGMNAEHEIIEGEIPKLKVRAFILQQANKVDKTAPDEFKEINTQIDTVWFFPELMMGVAIYRGVITVNDSDGLDVQKLLLACEGMNDVPRSLAYYQHVLTLRTDHKTALSHVFNESQLMPIKTKQEQAEYDELYAKAKRLQAQKVADIKQLHIDKLQAQHPDIDIAKAIEQQAEEQKEKQETRPKSMLDDLVEPPPIPQELIDSADIDLSPYIDYADALAEKAKVEMDQQLAQAKAMQVQHCKTVKKEFESVTSMQERVNKIVYVTANDLADNDMTLKSQWLGLLPVDVSNSKEFQAQKKKLIEAEKIAVKSQREARQLAPTVTVLAKPLPDNGARQIRTWVLELMANSKSLAGRDLAGADLSGLDFSGLDMRDVMLERANLTACNFTDCRLNGAVFTEAMMDDAVFIGSTLVKANFSLVSAKNVQFNRCDLSESNLTQALLAECDFSQAILDNILAINTNVQFCQFKGIRCEKGTFTDVQLAYSDWQQANFFNCIFLMPELSFANWRAVTMERCIVVEAKAQGANLSEVKATKVQFSNKGDFRQADLSKGYWLTCGFRGCDLTEVNALSSVFNECDFGETCLDGTNLSEGLFHHCIMTLASVNNSDCTSTYFNACSLRKVQFIDSDLHNSEMVNSDMTEAVFKRCQTKGFSQKPLPSIN